MRPIDADALMREFSRFVARSNNSDFASAPTWNQAVQIVENAPTVDAVPAVRCRDCKWNDLCRELHEYKGVNGFCSRGEQRR